MADSKSIGDFLGADAPSNWGKWGPDDELGCLNYLDAAEVLRGVQHIKSGEVFTLQVRMGRKDGPGDPVWPGRTGIERQNVLDECTWDGGRTAFPGGLHYADDTPRSSCRARPSTTRSATSGTTASSRTATTPARRSAGWASSSSRSPRRGWSGAAY